MQTSGESRDTRNLPPDGGRLVARKVAELHSHCVTLLRSHDGLELLGVRADVISGSTVLDTWPVPSLVDGCCEDSSLQFSPHSYTAPLSVTSSAYEIHKCSNATALPSPTRLGRRPPRPTRVAKRRSTGAVKWYAKRADSEQNCVPKKVTVAG